MFNTDEYIFCDEHLYLMLQDFVTSLHSQEQRKQHVLMLLRWKATQHQPVPSLVDTQLVPEVTYMVPGPHLSM